MTDNKKENALRDFCEMIEKSWTFARMSADEMRRCMEALTWTEEQNILKGTYRQRFYILHAVYNAFLSGIGYNSANWREETEECTPGYADDAPLF